MSAQLNFDLITATAAAPERWMYLVHGIYGAGRNWNAVARQLVEQRPDWGVVPVDLRGHGSSAPGAPPHTVAACADDLLALPDSADGAPLADAILGHSFGGKVATLFAHRAPSVRTLIIADSTPSARTPSGSAWEMLEALKRNPGPFSDRGEGIDAIQAAGYPRPVAQWMGTNLVRKGDEDGDATEWGWRLDPDQMEALLRDFFGLDAWPTIEDAATGGVQIELLRATESSILTGADQERAEDLRAEGLPIRLTPVEGGHWLNADNPTRVVELLGAVLPGS